MSIGKVTIITKKIQSIEVQRIANGIAFPGLGQWWSFRSQQETSKTVEKHILKLRMHLRSVTCRGRCKKLAGSLALSLKIGKTAVRENAAATARSPTNI